MELNFFSSAQLQTIGIASILTVLIVSAINYVFKGPSEQGNRFGSRLIVLVVACIATVLQMQFKKGMHLPDWQVFLTNYFLTAACAVVFHQYLGRWFVETASVWIKKKFGQASV